MSAESSPYQSEGWLSRLTDWFNPILVKEARQSLKSRGFVMTFMLMLIACWIVSFYYTMMEGSNLEFGTGGRDIFQWYYAILCFAVLVAVPFGAYRSLLAEREETTFDLLSITTLKPRQIVWGKLSSAMLQTMIYYAAIAPFIAFTSLLQGMDLLVGAFLLGIVMYSSVVLSMVCLTSGAMTKQKVWQVFTTLAMLAGLVFSAFVFSIGIPSELYFSGERELREPAFWCVTGTFIVWSLSYFFLLQQISTALLTFDADNRSSGVRIVSFIQFFLLWGGMSLMAWNFPMSPGTPGSAGVPAVPATYAHEPFVIAVYLSLVHWALVGLFAVTEYDELSPRLTNRLPKSPIWRFMVIPWMPGGARGFVYIVCNTAVLVLVTWICATGFRVADDFPWNLLSGACAYLLIFLGLASFIGRSLMNLSHELRPAHSRVLAIILLALFMIIPYLIEWTTTEPYDRRGYSLLFITVPHDTLIFLEAHDSPRTTRVLIILWALASVAVAANLRPMVQGVLEVLKPEQDDVA